MEVGDGWWRNFEAEEQRIAGRPAGESRRRSDDNSTDKKEDTRLKAMVYRCPPDVCKGGEINNCSDGHVGPLCAVCDEHWVRTGDGSCFDCGGHHVILHLCEAGFAGLAWRGVCFRVLPVSTHAHGQDLGPYCRSPRTRNPVIVCRSSGVAEMEHPDFYGQEVA
eukprot:1784676-Rhodomonas_salina.1